MSADDPRLDEREPTFGMNRMGGTVAHTRVVLLPESASGFAAWFEPGVVLETAGFGNTGEGPGWHWNGEVDVSEKTYLVQFLFIDVDPPTNLVNLVWSIQEQPSGDNASGLLSTTALQEIAPPIALPVNNGPVVGPVRKIDVPEWARPSEKYPGLVIPDRAPIALP